MFQKKIDVILTGISPFVYSYLDCVLYNFVDV